jgi:hypothetical protein
VYLKRVELDEDSDDERETTATRRVYYSMIAAKQINVKPGKEILFAIPGLGFDTQSLVFAATERNGNEDEEDGTNGVQEDNTYHPKMRKGWTRPQHNPETIASEDSLFIVIHVAKHSSHRKTLPQDVFQSTPMLLYSLNPKSPNHFLRPTLRM